MAAVSLLCTLLQLLNYIMNLVGGVEHVEEESSFLSRLEHEGHLEAAVELKRLQLDVARWWGREGCETLALKIFRLVWSNRYKDALRKYRNYIYLSKKLPSYLLGLAIC